MHPFETDHFNNRALLTDFDSLVTRNHMSFAVLLTRIAEIDQRRLYLEEGYSCMKDFLVARMRLTESAAYKRLTAARLARQYPGILVAVSDGRLQLRAVLMLGKHLTPANADDLVAAALDKTRFELEVLFAARFPRPDMPERLYAIAAPPPSLTSAPRPLEPLAPERVETFFPNAQVHGDAGTCQAEPTDPLAPERVESPRSRVVPLAPQKFRYEFTVDQETHDLCEEFRALMSHEIPSGEMALVFKAALQVAKAQVEKRKFAATDRPRHSRGSADPRHIPAAVKRAVRERDGDRCTFVSEAGKRCESRIRIEYDHIVPVARGGGATVENIRLRCRAHNQHAAEREFGADFMSDKRAAARVRTKKSAASVAAAAARTRPWSAPPAPAPAAT